MLTRPLPLLPSSTSYSGNETSGKQRVQKESFDDLVLFARGHMQQLSNCVIGTILVVDAERDSDPVSGEILRRFASQNGFGGTGFLNRTTAEEAAWDHRIVFEESNGFHRESKL